MGQLATSTKKMSQRPAKKQRLAEDPLQPANFTEKDKKMVALFDKFAENKKTIDAKFAECQKQMKKVEQDFRESCRPLFNQRSEIIGQIDEFYAHAVCDHLGNNKTIS